MKDLFLPDQVEAEKSAEMGQHYLSADPAT